MIEPKYEQKIYSGTIGCCGIISIVGFITGAIALTTGSICGTAYLIAGTSCCVSVIMIKQTKNLKSLQNSIFVLQNENQTLQQSNQTFKTHIEDLIENNKQLEQIKKDLQYDLEVISESVKTVGESTEQFMDKLRINYENLKSQNLRHQELNRQQCMLQLMQMFKHFDSNHDFTLSLEELKQNEQFLKTMYPKFQIDIFDSDVTFEHLVNTLISYKVQ